MASPEGVASCERGLIRRGPLYTNSDALVYGRATHSLSLNNINVIYKVYKHWCCVHISNVQFIANKQFFNMHIYNTYDDMTITHLIQYRSIKLYLTCDNKTVHDIDKEYKMSNQTGAMTFMFPNFQNLLFDHFLQKSQQLPSALKCIECI